MLAVSRFHEVFDGVKTLDFLARLFDLSKLPPYPSVCRQSHRKRGDVAAWECPHVMDAVILRQIALKRGGEFGSEEGKG